MTHAASVIVFSRDRPRWVNAISEVLSTPGIKRSDVSVAIADEAVIQATCVSPFP